MKQAIHILRKDLRQLWPDIALSLLPLAALAWLDIQRYDYIPSPAESLLQVVVLVVWAIVVAHAIQQESPADNRQFWLTRPYSRPSLVAAKAVYIVLAIHVPLAIADVSILAAHGFRPWQWAPVLAVEQVWVAAAWIVPIAAIAAATSRLGGFALAILSVIAAAAILNFWPAQERDPWTEPPIVKAALSVAALASAALIALVVQYRRRATLASRVTVGFGASAALAVMMLLPYRTDVRLQCAARPASPRPAAIRYDPLRAPASELYTTPSETVRVAIPVAIGGLDPDRTLGAPMQPLTLVIETASGLQWRDPRESKQVNGFITRYRPGEDFLNVFLDRADFDRLRQSAVTVRGSLAVTDYGRGRVAVARAPFVAALDVQGLGICRATLVQRRVPEDKSLKVMCESPAGMPALSEVVLRDLASGRVWKQRLGDAMNNIRYPRLTWLSPLDRRQTFFHLMRADSDRPGDSWLVPERLLPELQLEITGPSEVTCNIVRYTLSNVDLNRWRIASRRLSHR